MNEKQAREEHLLYKATIEMDMSDGDYNKLFGKVKTEVQQCEYDSEFKCTMYACSQCGKDKATAYLRLQRGIGSGQCGECCKFDQN
mmetsp:Transcript_14295/g.41104  ORF Transcript_14295/g.41104 Transcript_14295/m.41104 type:complete len:86 (+) Transcript_14295:734-991(+)